MATITIYEDDKFGGKKPYVSRRLSRFQERGYKRGIERKSRFWQLDVVLR